MPQCGDATGHMRQLIDAPDHAMSSRMSQEKADIKELHSFLNATCHCNELPLYALTVAFHNMVEYSVDKKYLEGKEHKYKCAKQALAEAPFANADSKSSVDTSCWMQGGNAEMGIYLRPHTLPGMAKEMGGEWSNTSVAACSC